ncbi:uncharacterized protein [Apostichopus japonicus]|uniref:uncharacterized protein n=1 Tax=Stichopus japonicus TaxID=307972 RepID=UPI003AB34BCC
MASRRNEAPGTRRGIFGTVVSLELYRHRCIISMDNHHGGRLGTGILNTTRLEESLKGVSDFTSFIGKNKPVIVTVVPLTTETWEVIAIRPRSRRPDMYQLPGPYRSRSQWKSSYCEQALSSPSGLSSGPPAEKVSSVIHMCRKLLEIWDSFPISEFQRVLQRQEQFADVVSQFGSISDILPFIRSFPQYFSISDDGITLRFPYRSPQDDFKCFIMQQGCSVPRGKYLPGEPVLIETVDECRLIVRKLLEKAHKGSDHKQLVVALDCEGDHLGKEGPLTLLQIATVEGEVFVFDVLATPQPKDMFIDGELKILLEEKKILKVVHDCRSDQCALYFQFGVTLTNVFDTSVAYITIWEQCNILAGPWRPKLSLLIELYGLTAKHKTDEFEALVHDKQIFAKRPLTKEMIQYAADDVRCLVPVIYEALNKLISPLWRPQFEESVTHHLAESRVRDPREVYEQQRAASGR